MKVAIAQGRVKNRGEEPRVRSAARGDAAAKFLVGLRTSNRESLTGRSTPANTGNGEGPIKTMQDQGMSMDPGEIACQKGVKTKLRISR